MSQQITTNKGVTVIEEVISQGTQSTQFKGIYILKKSGLRLKVTIKRDAYKFQSHARIHVFNDPTLDWNYVASIHFDQMDREIGPLKFRKDTDKLIESAMIILNKK